MPVRTFSAAGRRRRLAGRRRRPRADRLVVHRAPPRGRAVPRRRVPLTGDFNVANALCAIAALGEAGFDAAAVAAAAWARRAGVPGRLEQVDAGQDFLAVVDYAHKPDAVTAALARAAPADHGTAGRRDRRRRRPRPAASGRSWARSPPGSPTSLVVTDDNPRSEDPAAIRAARARRRRAVPRRARRGARGRRTGAAAIRLAVAAGRRRATPWWWPARATRRARRSPGPCTRSTTAIVLREAIAETRR